jgi:16S rRNA (adenine1518-N6/adenine1519-N6)-dimethyltransferase
MNNIEILNKHGFKFNKSFGQNFIFDTNFLKSIVDETVSENDVVLEIGAGAGTLTSTLCKKAKRVISFEIDKNLKPVLEENLSEHNNITLVFEDIMKVDMEKIEELTREEYIMVANLPYYITTPIIMALLEKSRKEDGSSRFTSITVMVQREVALRLCADSKKSDYGAITASINYYGEVSNLFDVAPENFLPAPKVTSTVVRIELYRELKYKVLSEKMLFDTIAGAFSQRRKTLLNSLSSSLGGYTKEEIVKAIENSGFDIQIRGERLSIMDFCKLSDELLSIKKR